MKLRTKLKKGCDAKELEAKRLEKVIATIKDTIKGIGSQTEKIGNAARMRVFNLQARDASENLRTLRGYGCDPDSTFYRNGRPKGKVKTKKKARLSGTAQRLAKK